MLASLTAPLIAKLATGCAILLAGLLAFQSVKLHFANGRIDKLEAAVKVAKADLTRCQGNRIVLQDALKSQNAAVKALETEAQARQAESAKALSAARKTAQAARADADRILRAKPSSDDRCEAASQLIAEVVG